MANTYTQLEVHVVFAVRFRRALLADAWRDELHRYLAGVLQGQHCRPLRINSVEDHVHLLFELDPDKRLSEVMRELKSESSRWINEGRKTTALFRWQEGYGAFSVSRRDVPAVADYIARQQEHHGKQRFRDEVIGLFEDAGIDFDDRYIFRDPE